MNNKEIFDILDALKSDGHMIGAVVKEIKQKLTDDVWSKRVDDIMRDFDFTGIKEFMAIKGWTYADWNQEGPMTEEHIKKTARWILEEIADDVRDMTREEMLDNWNGYYCVSCAGWRASVSIDKYDPEWTEMKLEFIASEYEV